MNKFRASYSVLSCWQSDWERAVRMYFKLDDFTTPAMQEGKRFHNEWNEYILKHGKLPPELGGGLLKAPQPEIKKVVQIYDWLELVGKIDNYDSPIIQEFKTGKTSSEKHASSKQCGVYAVLATYSGMLVEQAEIYHYDQTTKKLDTSYVWVTDKLLNDSINWIVTVAGEMHQYFEKENLYKKLGGNLDGR